MRHERDDLAREFAQICLKAAVEVMEVYESGFVIQSKDDRSPVTEADTRAEAVILEALALTLPGVPVLAEESFAAGVRPDIDGDFLLVDPVDGTKEFINRNGEFTINIALISGRVPVAGCVYAPALQRIFIGGGSGLTGNAAPGTRLNMSTLSSMTVRPLPQTGRIAVMSRSHADDQTRAFAASEGVSETVSAGSSLKFCLVAQGEADLYPRFGPTMEWDTAAGHAVLSAAGGRVTCPDGTPFLYGKTDQGYLNGPFVARGH
ncbi:MAG: 3'(2'), 5'-bisphosphate nucleotidase CysQ [Oceanicaulis sp. HLUCCA04]|nr:MAG: 3'(2'), 5'-bisphosphate nucleotidase CysQ [Oceanicaulis sp. HLUCCA04]